MLNLLHTKTFLTVLDERGFRAAARHLAVAPSTILEHIRQLEADLAAPLLVRLRSRIEPTAQGALFVPLARALVATAERAKELITSSVLRVAASSNAGIYLLQPVLASFQAAHPITVELWIGKNSDVAERLSGGAADIAIMEWWDNRPGFSVIVWRREPLFVIVSPAHPWAGRKEVSARDLVGMRILGGELGTGTGSLLRKVLGKIAEQFTTVGGFGSTEAVKHAVRAGQGISLVMAASIVDEIADGRLVALHLADTVLEKEIRLILPDATPPHSASHKFRAYVVEAYK
ncbi:MAG: LysR family transcriptional regulator [Beijerinckiaceae bacterium]